jgi:hypothetical protein
VSATPRYTASWEAIRRRWYKPEGKNDLKDGRKDFLKIT